MKAGRAQAATVARMRVRDERDAARLRERGWTVKPPADALADAGRMSADDHSQQ